MGSERGEQARFRRDVDPAARQAIERAVRIGLDPWRVARSLGVAERSAAGIIEAASRATNEPGLWATTASSD
ncbi:hypothetical protein FSW04_19330 [Baekduia soli]|uniref:Uncharacterized protein n=1 Tax=Baekduia soli TaxID=496014 RepID=A0A5B8U8Q8_9ACTN|nr:hypothetical protein [Baekduia soli]QEC49506.1 hypothetical protein FSW04_19330 [Baekduia soli]